MYGIFLKSIERHRRLPPKTEVNPIIMDMIDDIKPHLKDESIITKEEFIQNIPTLLHHVELTDSNV